MQRIENELGIDHSVYVELSEVFDLSNAPLVIFEVIDLKANCDLLEEVVHHGDRKVLMVPA